jgi:Flp pilus assembly protein TadG
MVTAELAVCLPVLVLLLAVAVSATTVAAARVRAQDAAREVARAAARGDAPAGRRLAAALAPGAAVGVEQTDGDVVATVRLVVHPFASWLPAITLDERAVAAAEPSLRATEP